MSEFELEVAIEEAEPLLSQEDPTALLLDCRNPDEYEFVHLPNAMLIPMDEIPTRVAELQAHQDRRIIVYCHMGVRSRMVAQWLRSNGFGKAQSLAGGIDAWSIKVAPTLPRY